MDISDNTACATSIKVLFKTIKKDDADDANQEIQFKGNQYVTSGVKSLNSFFGFFKALFRTPADRENNQNTIKQAREEIGKIFGMSSDAIKKFNEAFNSKLSWGSPLTKGALLRFKESLSEGDQEILEGKEVSLLEQSQSDADRCFQNAKALKDPKAKVSGDFLEISYWKKAGDWYQDESKAQAKGDKMEAEKCHRIATGYNDAANAYTKGKKELAHYLIEATEFYKAEETVLRDKCNGYEKEAHRFNKLRTYFSEAVKAEKAGNSNIAQYYSKAAKCLDAAYRSSRNRRPNDAKNLTEAARVYEKAVLLASAGEASDAASIAKEADERGDVQQAIHDYPER